MRVGVAEVRRRLREILSRVEAGETVEISRRDRVVARIVPPDAPGHGGEAFGDSVAAWRARWAVAEWPDDDPFAAVRDGSGGRRAPW